ncbi:hypothetical protein GGI43DRAFT_133785 [Trichoderma evansii]
MIKQGHDAALIAVFLCPAFRRAQASSGYMSRIGLSYLDLRLPPLYALEVPLRSKPTFPHHPNCAGAITCMYMVWYVCLSMYSES